MSLATERLIKNARVSLPGSLDDAILLEFFNVMDQFFRDSGVWSEDIGFSVLANDPVGTVYAIDPLGVSYIVRLFSVFNGQGQQHAAIMEIPGEVTLLTPPGYDGIFVASVMLSVADPVQEDRLPEFPEWVLQKYSQGILHGLLGRMMAQPAKPYTNAQLAAAHLGAFRKTISVASTESIHLNVHGAQSWIFPQSFSTRSRRR
jgi:hypothetical protein